MRAQDVRQVRVGLGQLDQQLEQLRQAGATAALLARHAQRPEAGLTQPVHRIEGQLALLLAGQRSVLDAREDLGKGGPQAGVVGSQRKTAGTLFNTHDHSLRHRAAEQP